MSASDEMPRVPDPLAAILERISDGIVALDRSWRYVYLNSQAGRLLGRTPESLVGKHIWTEFPEGVGQPFHLAYERAMSTGETIALEEFYSPFGRWFENRIYPSPDGLTIYFHDVTERRLAQDALRATVDDLTVTLKSVGEGVITTDATGRVRRINPAAERMTGWPATDAAGVALGEVVTLVDAANSGLAVSLDAARRTAGRHEVRGTLSSRNGGRLAVSGSLAAMTDEAGVTHGFVLVLADRESERESQAALAQSEERLRLALRAAQQGLYDLDLRTGDAVVTPEYATMLGYDPASFQETNAAWLERLHPDDRAHTEAAFRDYVSGRTAEYRVEFRQQTRDGSWRWLLSIGSIVARDERGAPSRMLGTHTDITDMKESQVALGDFKAVLDQIRDCVFLFDAATLRFRYVNEGARLQVGYSEAELLALTPLHIKPDFDEERFRALIAPLVAGAVPALTFTTRHQRKDGSTLPVEVVLQYVERPGYPPRFVAVVRDNTERVAAEAALRQSERNLDITLRSIGDAVIATDATGRVTRMNRTAERMTGWSIDDAIGRDLSEVFIIRHAMSHEPAVDPVRRVLETGEVVGLANHTSLVARDGREFQIADSAAPIRGDDGVVTGVVLVFSDVTEQYRMQQSLAERERRLRTIIENEPECVKVVSPKGKLIEMNAAGLAMLEAPTLEEAQRFGLIDFVVPEHRSSFSLLHRQVMGGERARLEFEVMGLRGTRRWLETHAAPLVDQATGETLLLGVTRDITARKRSEEERQVLDVRIRAAERMEALGQLAGGVAHDFNNLLSVIINTADLAAADVEVESSVHDDLVEIRRAGERAAALTGQLLAVSRSQIFNPEPLDLNDVVVGIMPMLERLVREDVQLQFSRSPDACRVHADRGHLERVLVNLAVNARDAMPRGGRLMFATESVTLAAEDATLTPPVPPGPYVRLRVSDTGEGMSAETLAHVFEPFFTTKERGRGTGLGLSTVYGTVAQSGGAIAVTSVPNEGTTFRIYLPRTAVAPLAVTRRRGGAGPRGEGTILVVDDEQSLVRVALRILEGAGYRALGATSGTEALQKAAQLDGPLDLLLTDVIMPGLSGLEVASRILQAHPETRVLYMSGYSDDPRVREVTASGEQVLLAKPYTALGLLESVQALIGASPIRE